MLAHGQSGFRPVQRPETVDPLPEKADNSSSGTSIRLYKGAIRLQPQGIMLFCDQAVHQTATNKIEAVGHVLLVQGDSITIRSDSVQYDGASQQVTLLGHVLFQDRKTVLATRRLEYSLLAGMAHYTGKSRVVEGRTVQTGTEGWYSTRTRQVITSPPADPKATPSVAQAEFTRQRLTAVMSPPQDVTVTMTHSPVAVLKPGQSTQSPVVASVGGPDQTSYVPIQPAAAPNPIRSTPGLLSTISRPVSKDESKESAVSYVKRMRSWARPVPSARALPEPVVSTADESDLERLLNRKKQVY